MKLERIFETFPVLESTHLVLQAIQEERDEEVFAIYNNDRVFDFCGIIPKHNIDTVRKMIGHFDRDYRKRARIKWGIFLKTEGQPLVGIIEAFDFQPKVDRVTVGYFLAESYWGRGIASEAVHLLVPFLLETVEVNRVQAEVMPGNERSKKVLLKNGFTYEGTLRQAALWSGKGIVDIEVYSILRTDDPQNRGGCM